MSSTSSTKDDFVTVVTGLPRSGTSMMMQMLAAGGVSPWSDEARQSDADNPRGYYEHEKVKSLAQDNSWLAEAKGHAVKIVAPLIPHLAPGSYRILFMQRDMDEVLRSQSEMLQRSAKKGGRLSTEQLSAIFQKQLQNARDSIETAGYPMIPIAHRECIEDPPVVARAINAFLGGDLDESAMANRVESSLYRQRA